MSMTPDKNVVEAEATLDANPSRPELWLAIQRVHSRWYAGIVCESAEDLTKANAICTNKYVVIRIPAETAPPPEVDAVNDVLQLLQTAKEQVVTFKPHSAMTAIDAAMERLAALRAAPGGVDKEEV